MYMNKPYTEASEDYEGFVYEITNLANGRKYIGQKRFWTTKRLPPLKGRKNKRIRRTESDWRDYWGSSKELQADILAQGEALFARRILILCANKNQMNYFEAREQFAREVLLDNTYYNGIINCRVTAKGI